MSVIANLKSDLDACKNELPEMKKLLEKLKELSQKDEEREVPESTRTILKERQDQLAKDIENYEHMLEEAGDLEKAWNKSGEEMKGINLNGNFYEVASIFESTVDVSADSTEMAHSSYKDPMDRVAFDKLGDEQGGEIANLPIVFDFGLLKQHKMGGWETSDDEEEFFSFTFKWDDEQFIKENPDKPHTYLDDLKIKATSVVVLYDDRTNRIVSFDVEPGFEHQWGYGRQRFMAKNTLSEKCVQARYRAIIKKHSDQNEYELGKYTIELLRQAKNQSVEVKDLVTFIADQTVAEVKQVQEINSYKAQITLLQEESTKLSVTITELKLKIVELETTKANQEEAIADLESQIETLGNEQQQQQSLVRAGPADTDSQQVAIDWKSRYERVEQQLKDEQAAHAATKEELETLQAKADEALKTIQQLNADRDELKSKIDELEKNIDKLIALIQSKDQEIETLKTQVTGLEQEKAELAEDNSELEAEKKQLGEDLATKTGELNDANDTIHARDGTIAGLTATIQQKETEIVEINAKHEHTKKKLAVRNNDLADAKRRAQEAIKILQPLADMDLSFYNGVAEVEVEEDKTEVNVKQTNVKETTVTVEETKPVEPEVEKEPDMPPPGRSGEPDPVVEEPTKEETVVEAERVPTPEPPVVEEPVKEDAPEEPEKQEPTPAKVEETPNADDDDFIQGT